MTSHPVAEYQFPTWRRNCDTVKVEQGEIGTFLHADDETSNNNNPTEEEYEAIWDYVNDNFVEGANYFIKTAPSSFLLHGFEDCWLKGQFYM